VIAASSQNMHDKKNEKKEIYAAPRDKIKSDIGQSETRIADLE
jgi:hypothetical protein